MEHRDDLGSKLGMWLFLFTEFLLFGGLFLVYSVYRYRNPDAFHLAASELDVTIGAINTVILLISSMAIAMSISAIQKKDKRFTLILLTITLLLGAVFLVNKYFEWSAKFHHGMYPGASHLLDTSNGEVLFFGLYFLMTGLHALHIIIGMAFIGFILFFVIRNEQSHDNFALLENSGLYWHLVDLIWIYLFPLFYLIT
jgi:cytochrome c oxidase subunit 3